MYGNRASDVYLSVNKIKKLHEDYPYINAEIIYTINNEFIQKPLDFLVRRTNLALIDKNAAKQILDKVLNIMKKELTWSDEKVKEEKKEALHILNNYI